MAQQRHGCPEQLLNTRAGGKTADRPKKREVSILNFSYTTGRTVSSKEKTCTGCTSSSLNTFRTALRCTICSETPAGIVGQMGFQGLRGSCTEEFLQLLFLLELIPEHVADCHFCHVQDLIKCNEP
jgi:hypothetical protein